MSNDYPPDVPASADTSSPPDAEFRRQWWDYVLAHGEPSHREHLAHLFDCWGKWNFAYFGDALVPPYILLAEPSNPRRLADTGAVSGFGGRCQIRIRRSLLTGTHPRVREGQVYAAGRLALVEDVLVHEMIHLWQQESTGAQEESYSGHGPSFRDKANEISAALGLPRVGVKNRGRDKGLPQCKNWPHNVRPPEYYGHAFDPPLPPVPARGDTCLHCGGTGRIGGGQ